MSGFGDDDALRRLALGEFSASRALRDADPLARAFGATETTADRIMREMRDADHARRFTEDAGLRTASAYLREITNADGGTISGLQLAKLDYLHRMGDLTATGMASASFDYALPAGPTGITARGVLAELEQLYGLAHAQRERDQVWRAIAGVGSLAGLAADLASQSAPATARAAGVYATARARMHEASGLDALRGELRAAHPDLFPPLRAPTASEIAHSVDMAMAHDLLAPYPDWRDRARASFDALATPWVRVDAPDQSLAAMAQLETLVGLTTLTRPGDPEVAAWLRRELGDYREAATPPAAVTDEPVARVGYLLERGFDPQLSELTPAIVAVMFAPIVAGAPTRADPDPEQVEATVRRLLKRIEGDLRRFIQGKLQVIAGDGWYRRVPAKVRSELERRREADRANGRTPEPPLHYADFDDYRRIIESPANWEEAFAAVFGEPVIIRETLRRIAIVRNPCQHFRTVTVEDMVTLRAELVYLGRWIGVSTLG